MNLIFIFVFLFSFGLSAQPVPLGVDQNTIALWNFDTDQGDTVVDIGPNQLNGTAVNTFWFPMNGAPAGFNNGRYFKDQSSYLDLGVLQENHPLNLDQLNEWSIEFLVNVYGTNNGPRNVFENGNLSIELRDRRVVALLKRNGVWKGLSTNWQLSNNSPHRVAVVFNDNELGIKVDGQTWASTTIQANKKLSKKQDYNTPIRLGGTPREKISNAKIGIYHGCLTTEIGDVMCWGYNGYGQLGDGTSSDDVNTYIPVKVEGLSNASQFSIGLLFTCALSENKTYCWGVNDENNLGVPGFFMSKVPVEIPTANGALVIDSGDYHTCIITSQKTLKCWGYNEFGQLGLGFGGGNALPTDVPALTNIKQISLGKYHSCAVNEDGQVYCWGWNSKGQLGINPSTPTSAVPQLVSGLSDVVKVEAGNQHTCALLSTNEIKCWGFNAYGQLGNSSQTDSFVPVSVVNLGPGTVDELDIGLSDHSCAQVRTDPYSATLKCWGRNHVSQLGQPTSQPFITSPTNTTGFGQVEKIFIGGNTNCFRNNSNLVYCFGSNAFGILGTGDPSDFQQYPNSVLATKQGQIDGHLDDIRISNIARYALTRPLLTLSTPTSTVGETNPEITISIAVATGINSNLTEIKLNGVLTTGLVLFGNVLSGQLNQPLKFGENILEVKVVDYEGNIGDLRVILKYSPQLDPAKPMKIATRGQTSCYVTGEGEVWCWGSNEFGQLGIDNVRHSSTPVKNRFLKNIQDVSVTLTSICAVDRDWNVFCWGDNSVGQLGNEDYDRKKRTVPEKVTLTKPFVKIVAGYNTFCAINGDGTLTCWGENPYNILGSESFAYLPKQVSLIDNVRDMSFGEYHACYIKLDNSLWCIGHNAAGQLGIGTNSSQEPLTQISGITDAKQVSLARDNGCVTTYSNQTFCWGGGSAYQIGTGEAHYPWGINYPVQVTVAPDAQNIFLGERSACVLNTNDSLTCWGQNVKGEIGKGDFSIEPSGYLHSELDLMGFAQGLSTACALTKDQRVLCWGSNTIGQAGVQNPTYVNVPTEVTPHQTIFQNLSGLVAGQSNTCMKMSGETFCWGNNEQGQLGFPDENFQELYPVKLTGLENVIQTSIGYALICHINPSAQAICAGFNNFGQSGVDPLTSTKVSIPQVIINNATQVEAGLDSACALKSDGTVWCWGNNDQGQLGNGNFVATHVPQQVSGLAGVSEISLAKRGQHACAKKLDHSVWCWGLNSHGQLGKFSAENSNIPVEIVGLAGSVNISLGARFTCSLNQNKEVVCIGSNVYGQSGIGDYNENTGYKTVTLDSPVTAIRAGEDHACALGENKVVHCWGRNQAGQLGNGLTETSNAPVKVINGVEELVSGSLHSCIINDKNKLACWGLNGSGQFGNGGNQNSSLPTFSDVTKK